jgi:hypothetical protein
MYDERREWSIYYCSKKNRRYNVWIVCKSIVALNRYAYIVENYFENGVSKIHYFPKIKMMRRSSAHVVWFREQQYYCIQYGVNIIVTSSEGLDVVLVFEFVLIWKEFLYLFGYR